MKHDFKEKLEVIVEKIIEGMNVLECTQIKSYTTLSHVLMGIGICIAIIAWLAFVFKTRSESKINFKNRILKVFLFFYIFGFGLAFVSVIQIYPFYTYTGRYTYKCILEDDVSANYIHNNFNVVSVENNVWTIEDK